MECDLAYTNQDVRILQGTVSGYSDEKPGSRFPYMPRNIGRLATTYEFQDATFRGLKVGANYTYTARRRSRPQSVFPASFLPCSPPMGSSI